MGNTLIFRFLYINVLNYHYFYTNRSTFLKIKNVGKIKNVKKRVFYRKIKTFINVYWNYAVHCILWCNHLHCIQDVACFVSADDTRAADDKLIRTSETGDQFTGSLMCCVVKVQGFFTRDSIYSIVHICHVISVHLSVRPSVTVTRVYCIKTAERIIEILSQSDRPIVFRHQRSLQI